jgi:N-methylhydantoinase A
VSERARIAVDIGGTFTDVVLEQGERRFTSKILTTSQAPDEAVIAGVGDVLRAAALDARDVGLLVHGTTLATNAIIERKGACTAFITTDGFRDVLEIGYESRFDQYDVLIDKPQPLVPRGRRLTVRERVDVSGRIVDPIVEEDVVALLPALDAADVRSVAVGYLHAYINPSHELRTREILAAERPSLSITLSSEACPEVREFERFTTATANAYVRPLMEAYLARLGDGLTALGLGCPVLLMTSGGGLTTLDTAMRFPIRLVESGPAGGAILASRIAAEMDLQRVISFDMGGTTAKICLVDDFTPKSAREFEVDRAARFMKGSGLSLRIPVIEMVEIGAGGGSIARVDAMRQIAVGPDSAGSDPGPAGYGRGGSEPTITDADIALGRIDPGHFAGGKVALTPTLSESAIASRIGSPLNLETRLAAYGITEMVDETMANAARVHAVEQGAAASDYTLVAFGGAAPLHVGRLAEKLGIDRYIVPTAAGVGSAIGFLRAPVSYDVVRSRNMRLAEFDAAAANATIKAMRDEAYAVVEAGAPGEPLSESRGAYMRYVGQGHEILVPVPARDLADGDAAVLQEGYDREYRALYGRIIPGADVEVLTWTLSVSSQRDRPQPVPPADPTATPEPNGLRPVFDPREGREQDIPLYWREHLGAGMLVNGPAIIAEDETSTFVIAGFAARIASNGNIVVERSSGEAS